jgi:hypothetical protein
MNWFTLLVYAEPFIDGNVRQGTERSPGDLMNQKDIPRYDIFSGYIEQNVCGWKCVLIPAKILRALARRCKNSLAESRAIISC